MNVTAANTVGSKLCIWCDKPIVQGVHEEDSDYKRKVYCNRFCSAAHLGARSRLQKRRPVKYFGMKRREPNADTGKI